jgi:hypothetical protein
MKQLNAYPKTQKASEAIAKAMANAKLDYTPIPGVRYGQDWNTLVMARALIACGCKFPEDRDQLTDCLAVLKSAQNTSAMQQLFEGKPKTSSLMDEKTKSLIAEQV